MSDPGLVTAAVADAYWQGGAAGQLLIARCQQCGLWIHPPQPVCPSCRGRQVKPTPVSGRGRVWSWTVNRYRWYPDLEPPYLIAQVELAEQEGLIVLSTLRGCDEITVGMPVHVAFEPDGSRYLPVFVP